MTKLLQSVAEEAEEVETSLGEDEQMVYVYLFNAHGIDVQTWVKMLHPSVYYEYSVNRPIYAELNHIEEMIRSKANRTQHGFISVAVKKDAVLSKADDSYRDNLGNPLIKVREGSLKPDRVFNFTHNGSQYFLHESGVLRKIEND